jgi:O-succinylbenzoic acid--CoA ligase
VGVRHLVRDRNDLVIDFRSDETHLLLNPRMPAQERIVLEQAAARVHLPKHVLIASSGSTGAPRLVALSKRAILASAEAVNRHLDAKKPDVWCCVLPTFHVGGLGIYARAALSGSRVFSAPWSAESFVAQCNAQHVTLSALVPAQVVDLLRTRLRPPRALRAIVVGGGALTEEHYKAARKAAWPVLPSYGMTECCSQIATATPDSSDLRVLDHLHVRTEDDGRLAVKGSSLLTGYIEAEGRLRDPKSDGWFITSDLGHVQGRTLTIEGRVDEVVKVGGELVNVARLEALLEHLRGATEAALVVVQDERLGAEIHLASPVDAVQLVREFNANVHPFERIRRVHRLGIPRSPLGKVRRGELRRLVDDLLKSTE